MGLIIGSSVAWVIVGEGVSVVERVEWLPVALIDDVEVVFGLNLLYVFSYLGSQKVL